MQESVLVDDLGSSGWILVVALHDVEALAAHLALYAHGTFLARFRVEHLDLDKRIVAANSGATLFEGVVQAGLCHTWRRLCQTVHTGNGHKHLFADLLHQFHRTERTSHDARTQAAEVEHREHRMVQLGYKHRGYTINGGTAFLMDRS